MKKTQTEQTAQTNEKKFFKFVKVMDTVEGTFNGFFKSKFGMNVLIDNKFIGLNNVQLKSIFANNSDIYFTVGEHILIQYTGIKESKVGNKVKQFKVVYAGKELNNSRIKQVDNIEARKFFELDRVE